MSLHKLLIIGIGNEFRRDDGAGIAVARMVNDRKAKNIDVAESGGEGTNLMDMWQSRKFVIIVDAASSGGKPGTIHFFNAVKDPLPVQFFQYSSHSFGVAEAVEVSKALQFLPPKMFVYGIEGENFSGGQGLSDAVKEAVEKVKDLVLNLIKEHGADA